MLDFSYNQSTLKEEEKQNREKEKGAQSEL